MADDRRQLEQKTAHAQRLLVGRKILAARVVIDYRPYAEDVVLDLDDGTSVSFCGEYDENTVLCEGDHGIKS